MPKSKAACGRLGGKATLAKHGREFFSSIGKKGGRPRLPALPKMNRPTPSAKDLPNNLKKLKAMYAETREEPPSKLWEEFS